MMQSLRNKGIKTLLITEPYFLTSSAHYREAAEKGYFGHNQEGQPFVIEDFFFGKAALLDVFKPETSPWFWQKHQALIEQGVAGWWGDLGEPEKHPNRPTSRPRLVQSALGAFARTKGWFRA